MPFCLYPQSLAEQGRELVSDPWVYLLNHFETAQQPDRATRQQAQAFVRQSRDFYIAAQNPHLSSQPVLLYYAFLNPVKAWIVLDDRSGLAEALHGIREAPANFNRRRLHL